MASASPRRDGSRPREGVKLPLYAVVLGLLVVGAGAWWWKREADKPPPPPSWSDAEAGTTSIDGRLEALQRAWNASDLDAVRAFQVPDALDPETDEEPSLLERRIRAHGWAGGLPTLGTPDAERTGPDRYTVTWPTDGLAAPIVTYWEWDGRRWLVATWQIPRPQ